MSLPSRWPILATVGLRCRCRVCQTGRPCHADLHTRGSVKEGGERAACAEIEVGRGDFNAAGKTLVEGVKNGQWIVDRIAGLDVEIADARSVAMTRPDDQIGEAVAGEFGCVDAHASRKGRLVNAAFERQFSCLRS